MNEAQLSQYAQLVSVITKMIATEPDKVDVHATMGKTSAFLEIHVAPVDVGRVLGKRGKTIRSLRGLMAAMSQKLGIKQAPPIEVMVPLAMPLPVVAAEAVATMALLDTEGTTTH